MVGGRYEGGLDWNPPPPVQIPNAAYGFAKVECYLCATWQVSCPNLSQRLKNSSEPHHYKFPGLSGKRPQTEENAGYTNVLSGDSYNRSGDEVRNAGLYVDLAPWTCQV